jgi:hypothetical protein
MRLVLAPKVAVVEKGEMVAEEGEMVAEEDEGGVVSSHRDTTDRIQSYNIRLTI